MTPKTPTAPDPLVVGAAAPFPLKPTLSALAFAEFVSIPDGLNTLELTRWTIDQIGRCITDDKDRERFTALWSDDAYTDVMLNDAFRAILDRYTGERPTDGSSPSSGGSGTATTGVTSTPDSSSPEATASELSLTTSGG